ncbi:MAG: ATP-binding protein [Anaerolineae bacterium]|nr:ATP-binding protein [Anaerolineae bacterium]MDW8172294.1 histidine kinase N-terminal 7TM domain-containing protein [Anaerolineae bacterium]
MSLVDWQTIFAIASIIAGSWSLGLAYLLWQHSIIPGASALVGLTLATAFWSLTYTLELGSTNPETLLLWSRLKYLGEAFAPLGWLAFALSYARGGALRWRYGLLAFIPLLTVVIALANPLNLFVQQASIDYAEGFARLHIDYGSWYAIHRLYSVVLMIVGMLILLLHRQDKLERLFVVMGVSFPLLVWLLNALLSLLVDLSPVAFAVLGTAIVFGVLRLGAFDLVPQVLDTLMDHLPDGVIILDVQNRILRINPVLSAELGLVPRQVIGKPAYQVLSILVQYYDQLYQAREAIREIELGQRCVEVRVVPLYENNTYSGRAIVFRDITVRKRAEQEVQARAQELQKLYHQVSELEQMKTDMIRMAAHDLKNPIGVVLGYLELLQGEVEDLPPGIRKHISAARQAAWNVNVMLSDILSLERIEQLARQGVYQEVNVYHVLGELIAQHRDQVESRQLGLHIDVQTDEDEALVLGDAPQLAEAISNLLVNAIKYTPIGGNITIRLLRQRDELVYEVEDDGYGIPQKLQERLFSPFYRAQTDETAHIHGTGLGLHLVRNIVERHRGSTFFRSTHGQGSTFGFRLPLYQADSEGLA